MKKIIVCLILSMGIGVGFFLPSFSVARTYEVGHCWKDESPGGSNDGYYKCNTTSCEWVPEKKKKGEAFDCAIPF